MAQSLSPRTPRATRTGDSGSALLQHLALIGLLLVACRTSKDASSDATTSPTRSSSPSVETGQPSSRSQDAARVPVAAETTELPDAASDRTATPPSGTVTLVVQKVFADCGTGGWAGTDERTHYLGTDLIVLVQGPEPGDKPHKEYVFCPSRDGDGGPKRPQLQVWQNCRAFPACKVVTPEAEGASRAEVQCGRETVVLENDGGRTILRGSFGKREIAPRPSTIAPVKLATRMAMVDC